MSEYLVRRRRVAVLLVVLAVLLGGALLWKRYRWVVADKVRSLRDPAPVVQQDHVRGDPSAPVTLVEYADLECIDCRRLHAELKQLQARVQFRWVFRHYPLEPGGSAERLAVASECAAGQNRFWQFVDAVYGTPISGKASDPVTDLAGKAGITPGPLHACMQRDEARLRVQYDRHDGDRIGINGTPTFFVNGKRYAGTPSEARLLEILGGAPG